MNFIEFVDLKREYNKIGFKCGKFGYLYQPTHKENRVITRVKKNKLQFPVYYEEWMQDRLLPLNCKRISCKKCRPILKNKLHQNIVSTVLRNDLNYHYIVTFPGSWLREKISYNDSYKVLTNEVKKLNKTIRRQLEREKKGLKTTSKNSVLKQGKKVKDYDFKMITLQRAQANPTKNNPPGYCHLHSITNIPLNLDFMQEKISKNDYKIGYQFIRENQSVADYLCKDFFDDDEWVIPYGTKHYSSTRNIFINIGKGTGLQPGEIIYKTNDLKFVEDDLIKKGLNLPFENQVKVFYNNTDIDQPVDIHYRRDLSIDGAVKNIIGGKIN